MRVVAAGLIALCLAYTARSASQAAFEQDGYQLTKTVSYKSGLGQIGTSINATILDNGKHKRVYYLEGDGYTMGYLTAQLAEPEASDMWYVSLSTTPCLPHHLRLRFHVVHVEHP